MSGRAVRIAVLTLGIGASLGAPVRAQEGQPPPSAVGPTDVETVVESIERRIDDMKNATRESEAALKFLTRQIEQTINQLTSRQTENKVLRQKAVELSTELTWSASTRAELANELQRETKRRDESIAVLEIEVAKLSDMLRLERDGGAALRSDFTDIAARLEGLMVQHDRLGKQLATARQAMVTDRNRLESQRNEIAELTGDITLLREVRKNFETNVAELAAKLETQDSEMSRLRDRSNELGHRLRTSRDGPRPWKWRWRRNGRPRPKRGDRSRS